MIFFLYTECSDTPALVPIIVLNRSLDLVLVTLDYFITDFQQGLLDALRNCLKTSNIAAEFEFPEVVMQPKQLGLQRSPTNNQPEKPSEVVVLSGVLYDLNEGTQKSLSSRRPVIQVSAFSGSATSAIALRGRAEKAIISSFEYEFCESWRYVGIRGAFFDRASRLHIASRDIEFLLKPCPLRSPII